MLAVVAGCRSVGFLSLFSDCLDSTCRVRRVRSEAYLEAGVHPAKAAVDLVIAAEELDSIGSRLFCCRLGDRQLLANTHLFAARHSRGIAVLCAYTTSIRTIAAGCS